MKALLKLLLGFKYAFCGIGFCIRKCRNFRIHTVATVFVFFISGFYDFSKLEYAVVFITIAAVLATECINTAIEQLCNSITTEYSYAIKVTKDVSAGAVLISAIASVFIFVFLYWDCSTFVKIISYFYNPLRFVSLIIFIVAAIIYIFYEDIFKK